MKRLINYIALGLAVIAASSCTKLDNYDAPDQTLQGVVTDVVTGKGIQGELGDNAGVGANSTRIRLIETSWSATATPQLLWVKQDGSFINTKLFKATYTMTAEGAFVPMSTTTPAPNQMQVVTLDGGTTTVNFKVEPLLRVEWVGEPVLNADKTITVQVKVTRGTNDATYRQAVTDVALFVNNSIYVGNNVNDVTHTGKATGDLTAAANNGTTLTITTANGALASGREYFIRVGARTSYGLKQYNYNEIKKVVVP